MEDLCKPFIDLPRDPHRRDMLEGYYRDVFNYIVTLCPTLCVNKTYMERPWVMTDPVVHKIDPGIHLQDCLRAYHDKLKGESMLFILDDCSANKEMVKKRDTLS